MFNFVHFMHIYYLFIPQFKHHTIILEGRARRYHERNLKNKIFSVWSDWACQEVLDSINKDQKAREYYIW